MDSADPDLSASYQRQLSEACAYLESGSSGQRTRGTGYLVTPELIATCSHVVPKDAAGLSVSVRMREGEYEGCVIAHDTQSDCALVRLERPVTNSQPLPLGAGCGEGELFWSVGFPLTANQSRLPLSGHVVAAQWHDAHGAPAILLFSPQVAAGRGGLLQGFSGSPVLIAGACVGHLKSIVPDAASADDRPYAQLGYLYACPSPMVAALAAPFSELACSQRKLASPTSTQPSLRNLPLSPTESPAPGGANRSRWDFFIAHAEVDAGDAVKLYELLIQYGHRPYVDKKCLLPGDDWNVELPRAQRQARMTVVLVSSRCEPTYYQREEIAAAIVLAGNEKYSHRVVPVHLKAGRDDASEIPYGLRSKQGLNAIALGGMRGIAQALDALLRQLLDREVEKPPHLAS